MPTPPSAGRIGFDPSAPTWSSVLDNAIDKERARLTLELLAGKLGEIDRSLTRDAASLVWASATNKDEPGTEGLVTPIQAFLALEKLGALLPADRATVSRLLDATSSVAERAVLLKTIGARRSRQVDATFHKELRSVADQIRGKDLDWLTAHTTGYGIAGSPGMRQPFPETCQLTEKDLAEAEFDPYLALRIALDPLGRSHPRSFEGLRQIEQAQAINTEYAAAAAAAGTTVPGGYEPFKDLANSLPAALEGAGFRAHTRLEWGGLSAKDRFAQLESLELRLQAGFDIQLWSTPPRGKMGHYESLVDTKRAHNHRLWRIHDPATGESRWIKDADLVDGQIRKGQKLGPDYRLALLYYPS